MKKSIIEKPREPVLNYIYFRVLFANYMDVRIICIDFQISTINNLQAPNQFIGLHYI